MQKTRVLGFDYGLTKQKSGEMIFFKDLGNYNKPLYVYNQFGLQDGYKMRNGRKIYPPFSVKCLNSGEIVYIGGETKLIGQKYEITCSKIEYIGWLKKSSYFFYCFFFTA